MIGDHNRCWKYLIGAISTHGEAKRSLEVLGGDKDRQLHTLWKETKIGEILPWDDIEEEAEKLIASRREERRASDSNQANQQRDDEPVGDEKNHLRKSFSDKGDLTLWRSIGPTKCCTS